jgi:hypothetical protein
MDPISRMVQGFTDCWKRFRMESRAVLFRIDTAARMHHDLARLLRGLEMAPDNRSPYLIVDAPFADRAEFFRAAVARLTADYAVLKGGLAEDGVVLADLPAPPVGEAAPEDAYARAVLAAWERLSKAPLEGLVVILLPATIGDRSGWPTSVERLVRLLSGTKVRVAAADTPDGLLAGLAEKLGRACLVGRFFVSDTTVQDYLLRVAAGGWAAVAGGTGSVAAGAVSRPPVPSPGTPPASPAGGAAPPGPGAPKVLPPAAATRLRTLMADAAVATAQNKPAGAVASLQEACKLCRTHGHGTEEAVILMAIGNNHLASGKPDLAIRHYEESAAVATRAEAPVVAAQARMANGSALLRGGDYDRAAIAYEQSARDAEACESDLLRIEALRLAGTCHVLRNRSNDAARCWNLALGVGARMSPAELDASTLEQVAAAFIDLCKQRGLTEQAKSVAQQVESLRQQAAPQAATP